MSSNIRNKDNKRLTEYKYLNKKEDKVHAGVKWDIEVPQGEKTKEEEGEQGENKVMPTLTMCERQVHWYGCNALSIRLVNHVASIPICPWYHLFVCLFELVLY